MHVSRIHTNNPGIHLKEPLANYISSMLYKLHKRLSLNFSVLTPVWEARGHMVHNFNPSEGSGGQNQDTAEPTMGTRVK